VHRQDDKDVCPVGNVVGEPEGLVKVVAEAGSDASSVPTPSGRADRS
jgi:hypothetical protein